MVLFLNFNLENNMSNSMIILDNNFDKVNRLMYMKKYNNKKLLKLKRRKVILKIEKEYFFNCLLKTLLTNCSMKMERVLSLMVQ